MKGRRSSHVFMQDNASAHIAAETVDFLSRHHIPVLDWPPKAPDLNPIENLWAYIKHEMGHFPPNRHFPQDSGRRISAGSLVCIDYNGSEQSRSIVQRADVIDRELRRRSITSTLSNCIRLTSDAASSWCSRMR
jgi:hypothetical protein